MSKEVQKYNETCLIVFVSIWIKAKDLLVNRHKKKLQAGFTDYVQLKTKIL